MKLSWITRGFPQLTQLLCVSVICMLLAAVFACWSLLLYCTSVVCHHGLQLYRQTEDAMPEDFALPSCFFPLSVKVILDDCYFLARDLLENIKRDSFLTLLSSSFALFLSSRT